MCGGFFIWKDRYLSAEELSRKRKFIRFYAISPKYLYIKITVVEIVSTTVTDLVAGGGLEPPTFGL